MRTRGDIIDTDVVDVVVAIVGRSGRGVVVAESNDAAVAGVTSEEDLYLCMGAGRCVDHLNGNEGVALHHTDLKTIGGRGGIVPECELQAIQRNRYWRKHVITDTIETVTVAAAVGIGAAVVDLRQVAARLIGRRACHNLAPAGNRYASSRSGGSSEIVEVLGVRNRNCCTRSVVLFDISQAGVANATDSTDGDSIGGVGGKTCESVICGGDGCRDEVYVSTVESDIPFSLFAASSPAKVNVVSIDSCRDILNHRAFIHQKDDIVDGCRRRIAAATVVDPCKN